MENILSLIGGFGLISGLAACGIVISIGLTYAIPISPQLLLIWFFTTTAVYSLNRVIESKEDLIDTPMRAAFFNKFKIIIIPISLIFLLAALILSIAKSFVCALIILFAMTSVVLYTKRLPTRRLKDFVAIKPLYVAFFWALIVLHVAFYHAINISLGLIAFFIFVFLKPIIGSIVSDMKDLKGDMASGTRTIPLTIGIAKTRLSLHAINIFMGILIILSVYFNILPPIILGLLLTLPYRALYIELLAKTEQSRYHSYIQSMAYGEFIVWPIFLSVPGLLCRFLGC